MDEMEPGELLYELADYQSAARTYRKDLLRLPILCLDEELAHMTLRPGIRYSEVVGTTDLDVELQPYVRNARQKVDLELDLRELKTYFGTVNADFDPNKNISTLMGHRASQASGDGLETTPQAQEVLALVPKKIGRKLKSALFKAKRNSAGKTTMDLFDGFDTIAEREIADGNISAENGNYLKLSAKPDKFNTLELCQEILDAMSPELRGEDCVMYVPQTFLDNYNRSYKLDGGALVYKDQYDQTFVEGSQGRLRIVPLVGKAGSNLIQICPESNMLVGCDQLSDKETVRVANYEPDTFTLMMRMFWGCEYESIDARRLLVVEIPE